MERTSIATVIAIFGAALTTTPLAISNAAQHPLLVPVTPKASVTTDYSYRALAEDRNTESIRFVQADASQIGLKTESLQIDIGGSFIARMKYSYRNPDGTIVWYGTFGRKFGLLDAARQKLTGEIADDPNNSALIVRNGDKLTGTILVDGRKYSLRPLKSGGHALVRANEASVPVEDPRTYRSLPRIDMTASPSRKAAPASKASLSIIRVIVAYTPYARRNSGDIVGLIDLGIAEAQQGYDNSGVQIALWNVAKIETNYVETATMSIDLSRFASKSDGWMDEIHAARNNAAADVSLLVGYASDGNAGLALGIGSSESTAFAEIDFRSLAGNSIVGHEIGHLLSARHAENDDPSTTPFAYGHGYVAPNNAFKTIMANYCYGYRQCPRINYWSNPTLTYGGQAMGTAGTNDNVRVLNTTAATVAAFR